MALGVLLDLPTVSERKSSGRFELLFIISYRHGLEIQEVTFGKTHPSVASALNNLAVVLCLQVNETF